jgi:hypothetical protein
MLCEKFRYAQYIRDILRLRDGPDAVAKGKLTCPFRESSADHHGRIQSLYLLSSIISVYYSSIHTNSERYTYIRSKSL